MIEIFQQIQEESQGLVHCPSNQLYKNPMEYFQTFYKVSTFFGRSHDCHVISFCVM